MAAKYKKIDPRLWNDEKFQQMNPMEKLLVLYCLTNSGNRIGIFKFSVALASEDIGYPSDTLRDTLRVICDTLNWRYDESARVLYLPNWWKYNATKSGKTMTGALDDLHDVPQTPLLQEFASNNEWLSGEELRVFDTHMQGYREGIPKGMPSHEHYHEHEHEYKKTSLSVSVSEEKHAEPPKPKAKPPKSARPADYDAEFEKFWSAYPTRGRTGKPAAFRSFKALSTQDRLSAVSGAIRFAASPKGRSAFVPGAAVFINQRRWEDDPAAWASDSTHSQTQQQKPQPQRLPDPPDMIVRM